MLRFAPRFGGDFRDLMVGHAREASQDIAEVGVGIETPAAATFDDGVNDGAAFAGFGVADEEPVLFVMASSS